MAIVDPLDTPQTSSSTLSNIVDPLEKGYVEPTQQEKVSRYEYIANQAKLGLTDSAVLGEALLDTFVVQPFVGLATGEKQPGFSENMKRLQGVAGQYTGAVPETQAPDVLTGMIGKGVRMATDPLGYFGTGAAKTVKEGVQSIAGQVAKDFSIKDIGKTTIKEAAKTTADVLPRGVGLFALGSTAEAGGEIGAKIEKAATGQDTGTGRISGNIIGTGLGFKTAAGLEMVTDATKNVIKQVADKYSMVKNDPDALSQGYTAGAGKRFLQLIANGMPSKNIDEVVNEFNRIGKNIGVGDIPLMVSMSDSPIARGQVTRLVQSSGGEGIRQQFNTEIQSIAKALDNTIDAVVGTRYTPVKGVSTPLTKQMNVEINKRIAIDNKLEEIADRFPRQNLSDLGEQANKLLDLRQAAVKAEMTPVYDTLKAQASKAGAVLPDTGVADIHGFVVANNMQDIFGRKTPLDNLITKNFAPVNGEYYPASFADVISLKEEINRVQRSVRMDDKMIMRLNELENVVDSARTQIKGDFNQRLKDIDKLYYEKVGIPFNAQGIKDIDAKKYADQVAPQIVGSGDKLRPFLQAAGDDGLTIANNAVMAQAHQKVINQIDGSFNAKALANFIKDKKNSGVLDQLPGMEDRLRASLLDDTNLRLARADIDDKVKLAEKQIADNFVLSVRDSDGIAVPDYESIANRIFSGDGRFLNKITKDLAMLDKKTSKAVMKNIQGSVLDKARSSTTGGLDFIVDPKNKPKMDLIFGKGYQQEVKDFMVLSDALQRADVSKITSQIDQKNLDVLGQLVPGLDVPYVSSALRDRISSTTQKVIRIVSRAKTAQLRTDTDEALKQLLADREGLKKLQAIKNTMDFKVSNPLSLRKAVNIIGDVLPRYMYGAAKVIANPPPAEAPQQPAPQFGSFEQQ